MTDFALHTADTTPEASKPLLAKSQAAFGMIPNLHAVMAEAPGLLQGYQQRHQHFLDSSFDATEKTVVWQMVNVEHNCHYCVPAQTTIVHEMRVDPEVIEALRNEAPLADSPAPDAADPHPANASRPWRSRRERFAGVSRCRLTAPPSSRSCAGAHAEGDQQLHQSSCRNAD